MEFNQSIFAAVVMFKKNYEKSPGFEINSF